MLVSTHPIGGDLQNVLDLTSGNGFISSATVGTMPSPNSTGYMWEFWVYPTEYPANGSVIYLIGGGTTPNVYLAATISPTGGLLIHQISNTGTIYTSPTSVFPLNQWTHVFYQVPNSNPAAQGELFINGNFYDTVPTYTTLGSTSINIFFGIDPSNWAASWTPFRGYLGPSAFWNGFPNQYTTFQPRTTRFTEIPATQTLTRFTTNISDECWTTWTPTGSFTFSNGMIVTPGNYITAAVDFNCPNSMMMEFYYTPTTVGTYHSIGGFRGTNNNTYRFAAALNANGKFAMMRAGGGAQLGFEGTTTAVAGTEYHVAICYDALNKQNRLYVNGVLEASQTVTGSATNMTFMNIFEIGRGMSSLLAASTTVVSTMDGKIRGLRYVMGTPYYYSDFTPVAVADMKPAYHVFPAYYDPNMSLESYSDASGLMYLAKSDELHRFWRIIVDDNGGTGGPGIASYIPIAELEMFSDENLGNFAPEAVGYVFSSQRSSSYPISRINDGIKNNSVNPYSTSTTDNNPYFGYDFGSAPRAVNVVKITNESSTASNTIRDFRIQYSDDGTVWTDAWGYTGVTGWGTYETRTFTRPI